MPNLVIVDFWACEQTELFSIEVEGSGDEKYTVRWDRFHHLNSDKWAFDYSCTCKAYKFREGDCKHIKKIKEEGLRCMWEEGSGRISTIDYGEADEKPDGCPECGGPVIMIRRAV